MGKILTQVPGWPPNYTGTGEKVQLKATQIHKNKSKTKTLEVI